MPDRILHTWERLLRRWCRAFHGRAIMFVGGRTYECRRCGRSFPNPWYIPGNLRVMPVPPVQPEEVEPYGEKAI